MDEYGVLLSFKELQKRDAQRFAEVVEDPSIQSPAELLRAIALDPRHPLLMRMEAAVKAAPYFDKKKPLAIETAPAAPTPLNEETLKNMSPDELLQLLALLKKAKVAVG